MKVENSKDQFPLANQEFFKEPDPIIASIIAEKTLLTDINGDQKQELIVIVRSVGTGSYQSAHAFAITNDTLVFLSVVEGLAPDSDPVAVLRKSMSDHK